MAAAVERGRRGGMEARRAARSSAPLVQKKFITRKIPVYELLTPEGLETLHQTSMTILEEVGIDFRDEVAVADWKKAGADIRGERLHLDRGLLAELLARAPAQYVQHARNPERSVTIGGPNTVLAPTYGSPFVRDFEDKRRYGTLED
jgi:trimethylamine--corrinoid protein Co-methyltransferase